MMSNLPQKQMCVCKRVFQSPPLAFSRPELRGINVNRAEGFLANAAGKMQLRGGAPGTRCLQLKNSRVLHMVRTAHTQVVAGHAEPNRRTLTPSLRCCLLASLRRISDHAPSQNLKHTTATLLHLDCEAF